MSTRRRRLNLAERMVLIAIVAVGLTLVIGALRLWRIYPSPLPAAWVHPAVRTAIPPTPLGHGYSPRQPAVDTAGVGVVTSILNWKPDATLEELRDVWRGIGDRAIEMIDKRMADPTRPEGERSICLMLKASAFNYDGHPEKSYEMLEQLRSIIERNPQLAKAALVSVIYYQGVSAMRRGENDN